VTQKIICVRGTSGAGKSWTMRQVLARFPGEPTLWKDGKKIEGYSLSSLRPTFLLGKYDAANTGGADTFKDLDDVEEIIRRHHDHAETVLFEGIRVNGGHSQWIALANIYPADYRIIFLTTPLEVCIDNIMSRRAKIGNDKPLGNVRVGVEDHFRRNQRQWDHFRDRPGVTRCRLSSPEAVAQIVEWVS